MRIKVKQSVSMHGKDYKLGTHEVPDHVFEHESAQKFVKAGWIEVTEDAPVFFDDSLQARQARIAEKLAAPSKPMMSPPPAPSQDAMPVNDESDSSSESESLQSPDDEQIETKAADDSEEVESESLDSSESENEKPARKIKNKSRR